MEGLFVTFLGIFLGIFGNGGSFNGGMGPIMSGNLTSGCMGLNNGGWPGTKWGGGGGGR